jgi:hypothetical protein
MNFNNLINEFAKLAIVDEDVVVSDTADILDTKLIKHIVERSYNLVYDEKSYLLSYIDENGDEHIAPDLAADIT